MVSVPHFIFFNLHWLKIFITLKHYEWLWSCKHTLEFKHYPFYSVSSITYCPTLSSAKPRACHITRCCCLLLGLSAAKTKLFALHHPIADHWLHVCPPELWPELSFLPLLLSEPQCRKQHESPASWNPSLVSVRSQCNPHHPDGGHGRLDKWRQTSHCHLCQMWPRTTPFMPLHWK